MGVIYLYEQKPEKPEKEFGFAVFHFYIIYHKKLKINFFFI